MSWEKTTLALMTEIGQYEGTNPVIACSESGSDKYIREIGNVLYEPTEHTRKYKTFYTGYEADKNTDEKIHYAYSEDGKTWTKSSSNPVIDSRRAEDPYVVKNDSTYYLFAEDKEAGCPDGSDNCYIRRWHSSDCETWTDDGQITGVSDCQSPTVWIEDSVWYMLYERYPDNADIALATSSDGLAWADDGSNPVMEASDTDWVTGDIVCDDIIKKSSIYYMFYHGHDGTSFKQGIATSTNLTSWTDLDNNPLETDEEPTVNKIITASVFYDTEDVIFYWPRYGEDEDTQGIYRGYPIKLSEVEAMADVKVTELGALTSVAGEDLLLIVDDPSGSPISKKITRTNFLSGVVSDTAYGASWNGDTTAAPSKNAVYDKIENLTFDNITLGTQTIEANSWNAITIDCSDGYNFTIYDTTNSEPWISAYRNLGVYLYYNGKRRLQTAAQGVDFTNDSPYDIITSVGPQTIEATTWSAIQISGAANFCVYDEDNGNSMIAAYREEGVMLYYDGSRKFETITGGSKVIGYLDVSDSTDANPDFTMKIGPQTIDASDYQAIQIYGLANFTVYDADNSKAMIWAERGGKVILYYNGSNKIETSNTGITVTGSCTGCDYVFEPEYNLMSLDELDVYVKKNECLPNMSVNQGEKVEFNSLRQESIEKIEELTLYTLQIHDRLKALEQKLGG
jgi:hypothetical protein